MRRVWIGLSLCSLLGASAALALVRAAEPEHGRAFAGTTVDGWRAPSERPLLDWTERMARRVSEREVVLRYFGGDARLRFSELGIELDRTTLSRELLAEQRSGSVVQRAGRAISAFRGRLDYPLVYRVDAVKARGRLREFAARVYKPATDARLDLERHRRQPDVPGQRLDVEASLAKILRGDRHDGVVFDLVLAEERAAVTLDTLSQIDVGRVLASYETDFRNKAGPREVNIRRAAAYLNGAVIAPGATFSFNEVVGPRTLARGFTWAPEIVNDELEPGIGGGVCQVASTMHAAAVYGQLDVVKRRSHSRPSGYAPLGLDATVIYGEVDLKLKNPYATPLMIHATLPTKTSIKIELLGRDPDVKVEHIYAVTQTEPFMRRVTTKAGISEPRRRQRGNAGYDIVSVVRSLGASGKSTLRTYSSTYYPVPEVYWVPPDFNPEDLPPLPEGASGVEGDGASRGDDGA
jgi:vancomycin resistance protein YoaR